MDEPKVPVSPADDNDNSPNNSSGQFMDFHTQTPKPPTNTAPPLPESDNDKTSDSESVTGTPALENASQTDAHSDEATQLGQVENAPIEAANSETNSPPSSQSVQPVDASPLAIPAHASHKSGAPVLVIVAAVVVALALAGLVLFTFMNSKKDSLGTSNSGIPASQTASKPLASPADVDATNKEIDASLSKIDDSKDFSATDLSDTTLGL